MCPRHVSSVHKDKFSVSSCVSNMCRHMCPDMLTVYTGLNSNQLIQGITISGASLKISQYADDTVIITDGSEMSLFEVNKV